MLHVPVTSRSMGARTIEIVSRTMSVGTTEVHRALIVMDMLGHLRIIYLFVSFSDKD